MSNGALKDLEGFLSSPVLRSEEVAAYNPRKHGALCDQCPLKDRPVVPPEKSIGKTKLVIVGQMPGRYEERLGRPFVGQSGKVLDTLMRESDFPRSDCHVTNAVLCRYEEDEEGAAAVVACAPRLANELKVLPKTAPIVAMGKPATISILGVKSIMRAQGFVWRAPTIDEKRIKAAAKTIVKLQAKLEIATSRNWRFQKRKYAIKVADAKAKLILLEARRAYEGRAVIPSIHTAYLIKSGGGGGEGRELWRPVLKATLDRACRLARMGGDLKKFRLLDEEPYKVAGTAKELRKLLANFRHDVAVDIETGKHEDGSGDGRDPLDCEIVCVGFSDARLDVDRSRWHTVVAYPWVPAMRAVVDDFLKTHRAIMHNGQAFDEIRLKEEGINVVEGDDTLIAHHAFASHLPQSLAHVGSVYCDVGPWKMAHAGKASAEEKGSSPWEEEGDDLTRYNATDVIVDSCAWHAMQPDLVDEGYIYRHDIELASICQEIQIAGIGVDQEQRAFLIKKLARRQAALLGEMRKMVGSRSFHPKRTDDIRAALFGRLKAPVLFLTPKGQRSTAQNTLEALRGRDTRAGRLSDLILRWRSADKTRSTFLEGIRINPRTQRLHPSWRAFGTVNGRLGCRSPNLMNPTRFAEMRCTRCHKEQPLPCKTCGKGKAEHKKADHEYVIGVGCRAKTPEGKFCGGELEVAYEDQVRSIYIPIAGSSKYARIVAQIHDALIIEVEGLFVYFDLSQSEMRAAAYLSGDERFIATCEGGDVHSGNAIILFPKSKELIEKDPKGAGKVFRDITKNAGFGILYLAEIETIYKFLLSKGFNVTIDQVAAMFDFVHSTYRRYYEFCEENIERCKLEGYLRTALMGRIRWFGWFPKPTTIANFMVQSFIADLMNMRIIAMKPRLEKLGTADEVEALVREVWAEPIYVPTSGKSFVMPVDLKRGTRWSALG